MPKQSKTGKNKWISLGHVISIFARGLEKTRETFDLSEKLYRQ